MKLCILTLSCVILAANAASFVLDVSRDNSELFTEPKNDYLPPQQTQDIPSQAIPDAPLITVTSNEQLNSEVIEAVVQEAALDGTAVLGDQGYEYKTPVLRTHRDVSHLKFGYLPPFPLPSPKYLPQPASEIKEDTKPSIEYLPPLSQKEIVISAETPQLSNEVLPPLRSNKTIEELSAIEPQPGSEYLPPAKLEEVGTTSEDLKAQVETISETQTEAATKIVEAVKAETEGSENIAIASYSEDTTAATAGEAANALAEPVEETAVFAIDGYHYKTPCEIPDELTDAKSIPSEQPPIAVTREYLPTLEKGVLKAEGPSNAEPSILAEDGYYYRIIKRLF